MIFKNELKKKKNKREFFILDVKYLGNNKRK